MVNYINKVLKTYDIDGKQMSLLDIYNNQETKPLIRNLDLKLAYNEYHLAMSCFYGNYPKSYEVVDNEFYCKEIERCSPDEIIFGLIDFYYKKSIVTNPWLTDKTIWTNNINVVCYFGSFQVTILTEMFQHLLTYHPKYEIDKHKFNSGELCRQNYVYLKNKQEYQKSQL